MIAGRLHNLPQHARRYVDEHWQATLDQNAEKLADAYARAGDVTYGTYLGLLFRPNRQLKAAGFPLTPDLPGDLDRSREWRGGASGSALSRIFLPV